MSHEQDESSSLTFQESLTYLRGFITKRLETIAELLSEEERALFQAGTTEDARFQRISGITIKSLRMDEGLHLIVSYLLRLLEVQASVNDQLLNHIKGIAGEREDFKKQFSISIGEIVKSALDKLSKEAEANSKQTQPKVPESLYV